MNLKTLKWRRLMLAAAVLAVTLVFVARLMDIQIVNAQTYRSMLDSSYISTQVIKATRGEIVDRNGEFITANRMGYDVIIDKAFLPSARQNEILLRLMTLMEELGEEWTDNLPITSGYPFAETPDGEAKMQRLRGFLKLHDYASAADAMYWLADRYGLEDYTPVEQRKIAGVRYEMEQRGFNYNVPYTFAVDIDIASVMRVKERSFELSGVDVVESAIRYYADGTVAPHIIGTVGPIYAEEYAELRDRGYAMDDVVGKEGVEASFESVLRGENGRREIYMQSYNQVVGAEESIKPIPGNTLVLSLDIDLQKKAQQALEDTIKNLQETAKAGEGKEADAGAVVAIVPKTGEILAIATYPSYDLSTYRQDYSSLVSDTALTPLLNRALFGEYAPGSTFKPAVALTGFSTGVINASSLVSCSGAYASGTHTFTCLSAHGPIGVMRALCRSCNIFFYDTGRRAGIDSIDAIAAQLGLGEPTGIEIRESSGRRSNPETKMKLRGEQWYEGDVLQSSIGQLLHSFTPLQLANYCATIANRGTRMKATIVHEIRDYSMRSVRESASPQVMAVVDAPPEAFDAVIEGMIAASRPGGTASATFGYYPLDVASKTGTPETSELPNSTFIAFVPAQDPQIAVAVVIEKGWHGYTGAPVAKAIFDAFFGYDAPVQNVIATPLSN